MLDLRRRDHAACADRRVRPDVGVADARAGADDRRAAHRRALEHGAALDDDAPVALRVDQLAVDLRLDAVQHEPVGLEHVVQAAGVLPPAAHDVRLDALAVVDEVLDRVGDLQLAARAGLDRPRRVVDAGGEHVDADEREVRGGLGRLLDEPLDAVAVELGHAVVLGIVDGRQQDQRVGPARAEGLDEIGDPALQEVVAEVHDERLAVEVRLGGQRRVRQAARPVLLDVRDRDAELRAVAGGGADLGAGLGRDDDPDLARCPPRPSPRCRRRARACWRPARAAWRSCG